MRQQKIQLKLDADTTALNKVTDDLAKAEAKVNQMKSNKLFFATETDAVQKLQQAESEVNRLKQQQIDLQVRVDSAELNDIQAKKDAIEADEINVQLNNQSAMQALDQIADGFSRIKSAASQVGQQFGDLLASAGKQETNFKFLENAVGNAETARQKMSEINDIVAKLPGDDTALQGLLSSAAAKDSSLTADNLRAMANSATDYFSAMSYYGKSATEAQQDMTNYLLAGNTAELERSPILQGHIDKLKEATTVQERSKALAEALNAEHWGGMGAMDTYNNKLETFNGMIERGRYTLGGMFQEGAKAGMDFLLTLDENTNGLVGMTIAAAGFASPITDALMGLGQMATGMKAISDLGFISKLKDLELGTRAAAFAQWLYNAALAMNPIMLVIIAITALIAVLGYLYFTNEDVRNAINGFGQALWGLGETINGYLIGALELLGGAWQNTVNWFTTGAQFISDSVTGAFTWITDSIMGFITFITTSVMLIIQAFINMRMGVLNAVNSAITYISMLPGMVGAYLQSVINRVGNFVSSLVTNFINGARDSVNNFIGKIKELPGKFKDELDRMLSAVDKWAATLPQKFWDAGVNAVKKFLSALGINSPGFMAINFREELKRMEDSVSSNEIAYNIKGLGNDIIHAWGSPELDHHVSQILDLDNTGNSKSTNELEELLRAILEILRNFPKSNGGSFTFNHYGDTDSEKRLEELIEAIRRDFYWNNEKAGRNVEELYGV